jgi:hypothetical protein
MRAEGGVALPWIVARLHRYAPVLVHVGRFHRKGFECRVQIADVPYLPAIDQTGRTDTTIFAQLVEFTGRYTEVAGSFDA